MMIRWTLATLVGITAGIFSAIALDRALDAIVGPMIVTPILTGVAGTILGVSQSTQLRSFLARPFAWIVASAIGFGAGLAAGVVIVEVTGTLMIGHRPSLFKISMPARVLSLCVLGLVAGAVLGAAQSWVMRRQSASAPRWTPRVAVALAAAFGISAIVVDLALGGLRSPVGAIVFVAATGALFGAFTGHPAQRATCLDRRRQPRLRIADDAAGDVDHLDANRRDFVDQRVFGAAGIERRPFSEPLRARVGDDSRGSDQRHVTGGAFIEVVERDATVALDLPHFSRGRIGGEPDHHPAVGRRRVDRSRLRLAVVADGDQRAVADARHQLARRVDGRRGRGRHARRASGERHRERERQTSLQ